MAWNAPSITRGVTRITYDWMLDLLTRIGEGFYPLGARMWWQRLAKRRYNKVRVVSLAADSWTHATGAETPAQGWTSIVAERLGRGSFGSSITIQAAHSISLTGNAQHDDNANPHMVMLQGDGLWTINDLAGYSTIDILYVRVGGAENPSYGVPRHIINGNMSDVRETYDADIELLTPGTSFRMARLVNWTGNSIGIGASASAPQGSIVYGIIARKGNPDRGVEWVNYGMPGWSSQQWRNLITPEGGGQGAWQTREPAMSLPADLLHIALGPNDALQGVTVAKMVENLRAIVTWYHTNVVVAPVLWTIIPWPDASQVTEAQWNERMDAIVALSREFEGSIVSDWRKWGKQTTVGRLVLSPTDFHLNKHGHDYAADDVYNVLEH